MDTGREMIGANAKVKYCKRCITPDCTFAHYTTMGFSHCSSSDAAAAPWYPYGRASGRQLVPGTTPTPTITQLNPHYE
jgi:hypothetical protein